MIGRGSAVTIAVEGTGIVVVRGGRDMKVKVDEARHCVRQTLSNQEPRNKTKKSVPNSNKQNGA